MSAAADTRPATLFGKLPCTLDFIRVHHDSTEAVAFDSWLQGALQYLATRDGSWPAQKHRFLFQGSPSSRALIGVVAPSRDRAGRKHPIAVFDLPATRGSQSGAVLALAGERFLRDAEQLLDTLASCAASDVRAQLDTIISVRADELAAAREELEAAFDRDPAHQLLAPLSSREPALEADQSYEALLHAARVLRAQPSTKSIVWELPAPISTTVAEWLAVHDWITPGECRALSAFWTVGDESSRMLLASGPLPFALPFWLSDGGATSAVTSFAGSLASERLGSVIRPRFAVEASVRDLQRMLADEL